VAFAAAQLLAVTVFNPEQVSVWLFGLDLNPTRAANVDRGRVDAESKAVMDSVTLENVARHMSAIVTGESRAVGYSGERRAWEHIRGEFERLGLEKIGIDTFEIVVPLDLGGSVTFAGGEAKSIHGLWPNQVRTPTLPRAQILLNDSLVGPLSAVFPEKRETFWLPENGISAEYVSIPRYNLSLTAEEQAKYHARRGQVGVWDIIDFSRHDVTGKFVVLDVIGRIPGANGSTALEA
jgi:hypothetical protein